MYSEAFRVIFPQVMEGTAESEGFQLVRLDLGAAVLAEMCTLDTGGAIQMGNSAARVYENAAVWDIWEKIAGTCKSKKNISLCNLVIVFKLFISDTLPFLEIAHKFDKQASRFRIETTARKY